jgi:hypothetical protein
MRREESHIAAPRMHKPEPKRERTAKMHRERRREMPD